MLRWHFNELLRVSKEYLGLSRNLAFIGIILKLKLVNPFRYGGGGLLGPPCRKTAISPEPNLCWTSDQSVNLSLSVVVQQKKKRALYLSRFKRGGPMKFKNTLFQIAKLRFLPFFAVFCHFYQFSTKFPIFHGITSKARDLNFYINI